MVSSLLFGGVPTPVRDEFLPQVEEFKYLGVSFTSDRRRVNNRSIGAVAAVMRTTY